MEEWSEAPLSCIHAQATMLAGALRPDQLAALRAGLTKPLGPGAREQTTFGEACTGIARHLQALDNAVGAEEARLAALRDLAELAHSSQAAGLAAALERASYIPWHQLQGLCLLAGWVVRALAAGPPAEQQHRAERLGQRALLQLLRWPVTLLGPGADALHHGMTALCERRETDVASNLENLCLPLFELMHIVDQHPAALSRCAPLLSSPADRPAHVRFLAAVVQVLLALCATQGYSHPEAWLGALWLLHRASTTPQFAGDIAGLMEQVDSRRVLPGLLLAYLEGLCREAVPKEGEMLVTYLGTDSWAQRTTFTTTLLSDPLLLDATREVLAGSSALSIQYHAPGAPLMLHVPAAPEVLKLALCMLRTLTTASLADTGIEQLESTIHTVLGALLFLNSCIGIALGQEGGRELPFKMEQDLLRHALDAVHAVTTWLSGLLSEAASAGACVPLSSSLVACAVPGVSNCGQLLSRAGEIMEHLLVRLEQPVPTLKRAMVAGEAVVRAAARLQVLADGQPSLETLLECHAPFSFASGACTAEGAAQKLCAGSIVHALSPAAADRLAAVAAGVAATCTKWLLLQQLREDAQPGGWTITACTASQAAQVPPASSDRKGGDAQAHLLAAKSIVGLLSRSLLLLHRLVDKGPEDQLTCRRHHLAALLAADKALSCPLVPQLYAHCSGLWDWEETPQQMQRVVADGIAWEEEWLLGMAAAEAGSDAAQLCRARVLALRRCSNLHCTAMAGASEGEVKARRCSGCKVARFCSVACQLAAWRAHKAVCRSLAAVK